MSVQAWEPKGAVIEEAFLRRCIRLSEEGRLDSLAECLTPEEKRQRSGLMQREPAAWLREDKYWPPVGRVDNAWGERNLSCGCPPPSAYAGDNG